jgi:antitoxin YefM
VIAEEHFSFLDFAVDVAVPRAGLGVVAGTGAGGRDQLRPGSASVQSTASELLAVLNGLGMLASVSWSRGSANQPGGTAYCCVARLAILIAMPVSEQMPLADVKNRLSEVVDRLEREHGRVVITKHGHPAAVVMSVEDLESLEETLDIMDSAALLTDIRESLTELTSGAAEVLSKDEALRLIRGQ